MKKILLATALAVSSCSPVMAQQAQQVQCFPRQVFVDGAVATGGQPIGMGLTHDGVVAEIWYREKDAEWLLTATTPNGITCLITWGSSWTVGIKLPEGERG